LIKFLHPVVVSKLATDATAMLPRKIRRRGLIEIENGFFISLPSLASEALLRLKLLIAFHQAQTGRAWKCEFLADTRENARVGQVNWGKEQDPYFAKPQLSYRSASCNGFAITS
jgi:hypothetical protein